MFCTISVSRRIDKIQNQFKNITINLISTHNYAIKNTITAKFIYILIVKVECRF